MAYPQVERQHKMPPKSLIQRNREITSRFQARGGFQLTAAWIDVRLKG
jgi:hypothetical protein